MKRILLIILFIFPFSLFANEKRVTKEMLLGDWKCTLTKQEAKWKNGTFQDYGNVTREKVLITYKNYDGLLMKGSGDDINKGDWNSVSSYVAIQDGRTLKISETARLSISSKFEYISDKEYKFTQITEFVFHNLPEEEQVNDNSRQKLEESCIKVAH